MKRLLPLLALTPCLWALSVPTRAQAPDPLAAAEAKLAAGDTAGAVEVLQRAVAKGGASAALQLELGRLLVLSNELDLGIEALQAAAAATPGGAAAEALGRLALAQELRGMRADADASADAALAANPGSAWSALAASRARARAGAAEEAVALAEQAVAAGGGPAADAALGFAREAQGDLGAAEAAYRAAHAEAAADLAITIDLARVLRRTNRAAEAEPLLAAALAAAPGAVPAYKEMARVKIALGKAMEALGAAATAAALAPDDPEAQALQKEVTVARALSYLSDPAQAGLAIPDLQALIEQEPDFVVGHVGLAQAYITQQQAAPAQAALDKALALEPGHAEALYLQGHLRMALKGDFPGAVQPLAKAVAAEPGNLKYRTEYGLALKQVQQFPEAIAELQRVAQSPGYDRADAWMYLGEAQVGARHYPEALKSLERAARIAGSVARIEAMLAWAYFGTKDADNFIKHGAKARELGYPDETLLSYLKRIESGEPIR